MPKQASIVQTGVPLEGSFLAGLGGRLIPREEKAPVSLAEFVERTAGFVLEPWQRIICERLERLKDERGVRLLLHAPP